jgi:hypothetical protein
MSTPADARGNVEDVVGKEKRDAAEAARQAAEVAALNIQKYLDMHDLGRAQSNNMIMHEEQFSRVVESSLNFANESMSRFLELSRSKQKGQS